MVSKQILKQYLTFSTENLFRNLDRSNLPEEHREAILEILKRRKRDISKYVQEEEVPVPVLRRAIDLLQKAIDFNDLFFLQQVYEVMGPVSSLEQCSLETVNEIIVMIEEKFKIRTPESQMQRSIDEDAMRRLIETSAPKREKLEPSKPVVKSENKVVKKALRSSKEPVLSEEFLTLSEIQIARSILQESVTNKIKITKFYEAGFDRSKVLQIKFADPTYVYDNWRVLEKAKQK